MHKKEFIVEVNSADDGDILLWQLPKDWLPPIPIKKELIRCKDCKFNEGYCENETFNHHLEPLGLDGGALFETRPDFYCAYGKRREE